MIGSRFRVQQTGLTRRRLGMLVHHTDAQREFTYDRKSIVGKLDKGIDNAKSGGWSLIDMKADWARVFSK